MTLEIRSFADPGDIQKERLILKASSDTDVGDYAVLRSGMSSGKPTSGRKRAYWFPYSDVKGGDLVVLYTKKGSRSKKPIAGGSTAHFFYWGNETPLWDENHCAVLLFGSEWDYRSLTSLERENRPSR